MGTMSYRYRVLFVNTSSRSWKIKEYGLKDDVLGPIDLGVKLHLEEYESWKYDVFSPNNVFVLGRGLFSGGRLIGVHRLITVFRSPLTRSLHVSAIGGVAYKFMRSGIHAVVVEGKSSIPLIILISGDEKGSIDVKFNEITLNKLEDVYRNYDGKEGVYALTKYIMDEYEEFIKENNARPIVVGPSAIKTIHGALFSLDIDIKRKSIALGAEDSAARGGPGSVLFQAHGVIALIIGGKYKPSDDNPKLSDINLVNSISRKVHGKDYIPALNDATIKYRYNPKLGTGGTFGVNYLHYRDLIPTFAYNMMYLSKTLRLKHYEMIMKYFWKPFNVEVFEKARSWYNCGEPCPVVCKKVWRGKKVDYEPFNAMGPLIGVFSFEKTIELVDVVDALGFDVIEMGHIISWIFDAIHRGLLQPEEVGLDSKPFFDPISYDVKYSEHNAKLALKIVRGLIEKNNEVLKLIAEKGIRGAAKILDNKFKDRISMIGLRFEDIAIYGSFDNGGYMTPNLYWTPGMIAPLFILGRYWTNYSPTFMSPEEYAKSSLERALKEYLIDNAGLCRFHRGWAEKMLQDLYREIWGVNVNLIVHAKKIYKKIAEYSKKARATPTFWDTKKAKDLIASIATEIGIEEWAKKFSINIEESAREWWDRFNKTIEILLK